LLSPAGPVAGELVGDQPEKEKQHQGGEHHLQGKIEFRSGEQDPHRHSAQNDESQNQTGALAGWFHGGLVEWAWFWLAGAHRRAGQGVIRNSSAAIGTAF